MDKLPSKGQLQGDKIDYDKWNMLIKISRKYEKNKYGEEYYDLSGFTYFLGSFGNNIVLNTEEPKIVPNYCEHYTEKEWKNMWKMIHQEYDEEFIKDFKKCLKILKKYTKEKSNN